MFSSRVATRRGKSVKIWISSVVQPQRVEVSTVASQPQYEGYIMSRYVSLFLKSSQTKALSQESAETRSKTFIVRICVSQANMFISSQRLRSVVSR